MAQYVPFGRVLRASEDFGMQHSLAPDALDAELLGGDVLVVDEEASIGLEQRLAHVPDDGEVVEMPTGREAAGDIEAGRGITIGSAQK